MQVVILEKTTILSVYNNHTRRDRNSLTKALFTWKEGDPLQRVKR